MKNQININVHMHFDFLLLLFFSKSFRGLLSGQSPRHPKERQLTSASRPSHQLPGASSAASSLLVSFSALQTVPAESAGGSFFAYK